MTLRVIGLDELRSVVTPDLVFAAVRSALIAHAEGQTQVPLPMVLDFPKASGDCHVKAGYVEGSPHFTVKIASTFASVNNGLMLVVDATTGEPAAVLADEGRLTAWRTAAAGALITDAMAPAEAREVLVVGTGDQARLQAIWLTHLRPGLKFQIWGRRPAAVTDLVETLQAAGVQARPVTESAASCVTTTTPATRPLPIELFGGAQHITGVGTDMPGKGELPPGLFAGATVVTDDHEQCLDHGDFGNAVRAGVIADGIDLSVGAVLRDGFTRRTDRSIADLTGLGVQDAATASAVIAALGG
ncbi:ornithine cyclodeaminase family protein [Kribbella italica]|uniref:Ornithine cyclodeaminase n=1 Tax=Kribbella italica TaxID=1540520 RepID=A0A7W9MXG3_9ACTN|nr:ornithine cyclodeaminase family protein [Kribbella italica]MBB5839327.1 ornithine cyclodeaminase [Kribbella italica]